MLNVHPNKLGQTAHWQAKIPIGLSYVVHYEIDGSLKEHIDEERYYFKRKNDFFLDFMYEIKFAFQTMSNHTLSDGFKKH